MRSNKQVLAMIDELAHHANTITDPKSPEIAALLGGIGILQWVLGDKQFLKYESRIREMTAEAQALDAIRRSAQGTGGDASDLVSQVSGASGESAGN
jgi:hypothetical protein